MNAARKLTARGCVEPVANGAIRQEKLHGVGWTREQYVSDLQDQRHRGAPPHTTVKWRGVGEELHEEVRTCERIAVTSVNKTWVWERGLCAFPWSIKKEARKMEHEPF